MTNHKYGPTDQEAKDAYEARLRLIAELLEALEQIQHHADRKGWDFISEVAEQAIAKARGDS